MVESGGREIHGCSGNLSPCSCIFTHKVYHSDAIFGGIHKVFAPEEGKHGEGDEEAEGVAVQQTRCRCVYRKRGG